jgi:hypothetical protein
MIIIFSILVLILILLLLLSHSEKYDYDKENPNALRTGYNVAGTVYASYPGNNPGLGWVL